MRLKPHDLVNGFTWNVCVKGLITIGSRASLSTYASVARSSMMPGRNDSDQGLEQTAGHVTGPGHLTQSTNRSAFGTEVNSMRVFLPR